MRELTLSLKKMIQQGSLVFFGMGLIWCLGEIPSLAQAAEWATSGSNIYNTNTGNVGIGTPAPGLAGLTRALTISGGTANGQTGGIELQGGATGADNNFAHVEFYNGSTRAIAIQAVRSGADNSARLDFLTTNAGTFGSPDMTILPSGNVGIGTMAPSSLLHISGNSALVNPHIWLTDTNTGGRSWRVGPGVIGAGNFSIYDQTAATPRFLIDASGNVGIGTTILGAYKLNVNGDAYFNGTVTGTNIMAQYQDLAEWVPASELMPPGTVLVLDPDHFNQVEASSQAYDTRVAGVITDTPGILLGEGGKDKVKAATTGRVKVKVDAGNGSVQVGDLLVTSDREGYAMKSQPIDVGGVPIHRPGTLIGKALEPLKEGKGEILVLLSLQ